MGHAEIIKTLNQLNALQVAHNENQAALDALPAEERKTAEHVTAFEELDLGDTLTEEDLIWALTTSETTVKQKFAAIYVAYLHLDGMNDALCMAIGRFANHEDPELAGMARETLNVDAEYKERVAYNPDLHPRFNPRGPH